MDAVDFWNKTFAETGTPFRIGAVGRTSETLPVQYLQSLSDAVLDRKPLPQPPGAWSKIEGDLIVALSDGDFVSFSTGFLQGRRVIVGIKTDRLYPLTLPNVARNVIAHELGHAIGLGTTTIRENSCAAGPRLVAPMRSAPAWKSIFP